MPRNLLDQIEDILLAAGHELPPFEGSLSDDNQQQLLEELLDELQPFDIAHLLINLPNDQQLQLLRMLPAEMAAEALEHLEYEQQYRLLDDLEDERAREVLAKMDMHHLVDFVEALHPLRAQVVLNLVPKEQRPQIDQFQNLPEDSAGRHINVRYLQAREHWTAKQVINHFRKVGHDVDISNYIYVVDAKGHLVGVASLRDVILSPEDTPLSDIMYTKVVTVDATAKQEYAAQLLTQYDFVALPVVNESGKLLGVISVDDMIDVVQDEATEDIQLLGGSTPLEDAYLQTKLTTLFRSRIGWLLALFFAEAFTGTIMRYFESVLEQVVSLAFFIPLLIGTGGNSGSQAATMITRAIALGEVSMKDFAKVVWREARVSLALGVVMAMAGYLRALMLGESSLLGLTVGITIWLIVIVGSTTGAILPLIGKRLGIDPAVFSAPLITTVVDALGLIIYFKVAVWLLNIG